MTRTLANSPTVDNPAFEMDNAYLLPRSDSAACDNSTNEEHETIEMSELQVPLLQCGASCDVACTVQAEVTEDSASVPTFGNTKPSTSKKDDESVVLYAIRRLPSDVSNN